MKADTDLEIRLVGGLVVRRGGRVAALPASRKTRALLAYLVLTGRPHTREHLCRLLWDTPDDPRAALRWSLSKLRGVIGAAHLVADGDRIGFDASGVTVDLAVARAGAQADTLDELRVAGELLSAELCDGLDLPDAFAFVAWLAGEREAVSALRRRVLAALVDRLSDEPDEALAWARRRLAFEPVNEQAHADVVRLLGRVGGGAEALRQHEASCRMLARELGAGALPALERARVGLRVAPPAQGPTPAVAIAPVAAAIPAALVGRAVERELIARWLGDGRGALGLLGEPGIGKSALLAELVRGCPGRALTARPFEAERARTYGVWTEIIRTLPASLVPGDLRDALDGLGQIDEPRIHGAAARLCEALAPLVIVIDDFQWCDDASAALLHQLARTGVPIALAARPGELADARGGLRVWRSLERQGLLRTLQLGPLDEAEVAALVGEQFLAEVMRRSHGNPLFALELARALAVGDQTSETLEQMVSERVERLDAGARELVAWAAVAGRRFAPELVRVAAGMTPGEAVEALGILERHQLVRPAGDVAYEFHHDLIRDAAYRQQAAPRRRLIHLHLARALAAGGGGAHGDELARHAALGGDDQLAAEASLAAARHAVRLAAHVEARAWVAMGLSHAARLAGPARIPMTVALRRTQVQAEPATPALIAAVEEIAAEAAAAGLADAIVDAGLALAALHHAGGNTEGAAHGILLGVEASREATDDTELCMLANGGLCKAWLQRDLDDAGALLARAGALARRIGRTAPDLDLGEGVLHRLCGEPAAARASLGRALTRARADQDAWREFHALVELAWVDLEERLPERVLERSAELAAAAARLAGGSEPALAVAIAAIATWAAGGEVASLDDAVDQLRALDATRPLGCIQGFAAELDLAAGRLDEAAARAAEARRIAVTLDARVDLVAAASIESLIAARRGDRDGAIARLVADELPGSRGRAQRLRAAAAVAVGATIPHAIAEESHGARRR